MIEKWIFGTLECTENPLIEMCRVLEKWKRTLLSVYKIHLDLFVQLLNWFSCPFVSLSRERILIKSNLYSLLIKITETLMN